MYGGIPESRLVPMQFSGYLAKLAKLVSSVFIKRYYLKKYSERNRRHRTTSDCSKYLHAWHTHMYTNFYIHMIHRNIYIHSVQILA